MSLKSPVDLSQNSGYELGKATIENRCPSAREKSTIFLRG